MYHDAWIGEDDTPESLHMEDNGQDFQKSLSAQHTFTYRLPKTIL